MLCFPNAKINIGLNITKKRADGFHDLETIFYPVGLCDALEFAPLSQEITTPYEFHNSGIEVDGPQSDNIIIKAYQLLQKDHLIPPLHIHLHKNIPFGAGLGGGSADAAFMIHYLDKAFGLNIPLQKQEEYASQLGSDCAFFIANKPTFAYGRGELFSPINLDLSNYHILLVKPNVAISTAQAYANINPHTVNTSLTELTQLPIDEWEGKVINDFEKSIFPSYPQLQQIKDILYKNGALYASMSGSGSTIYGIFREIPTHLPQLERYFTWSGKML